MAEKITLKNMLANLPQKTDVETIVGRDASGNPVYIKKADLAQVVAELIGIKDNISDKVPQNRYSSSQAYRLSSLSKGIIIGHSDRNKSVSAYAVDGLNISCMTTVNNLLFYKDGDKNLYVSGGGGGFIFMTYLVRGFVDASYLDLNELSGLDKVMPE